MPHDDPARRIRSVRRRLLRNLTAGLAAGVLALAAPGAARAQDDAAASGPELADRAADYITDLSRTAIRELGAQDIDPAERAERGRALLEAHFAARDLARFVLGRYWRVASDQQRARFMTLLREVALTRFLPTFQNLSMDQVTIERAIPDPQAKGVARVDTRVDVPERGPVKLAWRVRPSDGGGFQIVDLMAEGVSMAITLRSEYSSVIKQNGGRVEALLTRLEKRLKSDGAADWAEN